MAHISTKPEIVHFTRPDPDKISVIMDGQHIYIIKCKDTIRLTLDDIAWLREALFDAKALMEMKDK